MDNDTLQLIAVLAIVVAAAGYLLRRAWRKQKGEAPACDRCEGCRSKCG